MQSINTHTQKLTSYYQNDDIKNLQQISTQQIIHSSSKQRSFLEMYCNEGRNKEFMYENVMTNLYTKNRIIFNRLSDEIDKNLMHLILYYQNHFIYKLIQCKRFFANGQRLLNKKKQIQQNYIDQIIPNIIGYMFLGAITVFPIYLSYDKNYYQYNYSQTQMIDSSYQECQKLTIHQIFYPSNLTNNQFTLNEFPTNFQNKTSKTQHNYNSQNQFVQKSFWLKIFNYVSQNQDFLKLIKMLMHFACIFNLLRTINKERKLFQNDVWKPHKQKLNQLNQQKIAFLRNN